MKAKLIRRIIEKYIPETLFKGKCENYELLHVKREVDELERLAEIGKAVETAVLEGSPWIIDTYSGINTCPNEEDIKTLISWYRGEVGEK